MADANFRFKLGKLECLVVSDGYLIVPASRPKTPGPPDLKNGTRLDVLSLFIDTGKNKVLVDTGCGDGFQPTTGKLVSSLEAVGIKCTDIDTIIITHGHPDHAGGAYDANGRANFPNARYIAAKAEWECWATRRERVELHRMFAQARQYFLPIRDKFDLVEDNTEVLPGIKLKIAPGHTPGNSVLEISSNNRKLFCLGDTLHDQTEFTQPDRFSFLDVDPELATLTRTRVPLELSKSGMRVFACHFDFPGLGYIVQKDGILGWRPDIKR
jgi:glyoxylase-like metal-dependent hydrolase (beta-lactamase superfamily II)